jgi:hypothetical protein
MSSDVYMHDLIVAVAFTNMCGGTQGIEAFNVARRPPIRLHDEGYAKGTQKCQHESESLCPPRCVSPVELPKWSEDCAKRGDFWPTLFGEGFTGQILLRNLWRDVLFGSALLWFPMDPTNENPYLCTLCSSKA